MGFTSIIANRTAFCRVGTVHAIFLIVLRQASLQSGIFDAI